MEYNRILRSGARVILNRIDEESTVPAKRGRRVMSMVSPAKKTDESTSSHPHQKVVPGKRARRVMTMVSPPEKTDESTSSHSHQKVVPAERNRRLFSVSGHSGEKQNNSPAKADDALTKSVGLNCKLTNELLEAKKGLLEKTNQLLAMQQKCHDKDMESKDLCLLLESKNVQISQLKEHIEKLKAERFCEDLIDFDGKYSPKTLIFSHLMCL